MTPTEIATELARTGICVCPHFLESSMLTALQQDFSSLHEGGQFKRAGVGSSATVSIQDSIRQDEIYWLEPLQIASVAQQTLWQKFEVLQTEFNRNLFLGLDEIEAHYACYPPGGFYSRHIDAFTQENSRVVSLVIYLNDNWEAADGGRLRLYEQENSVNKQIDVDPVGGTLVCFMSQETEHEVLPSLAPRKSIAGWFRRTAATSRLR